MRTKIDLAENNIKVTHSYASGIKRSTIIIVIDESDGSLFKDFDRIEDACLQVKHAYIWPEPPPKKETNIVPFRGKDDET
jgi:hypothetical protein